VVGVLLVAGANEPLAALVQRDSRGRDLWLARLRAAASLIGHRHRLLLLRIAGGLHPRCSCGGSQSRSSSRTSLAKLNRLSRSMSLAGCFFLPPPAVGTVSPSSGSVSRASTLRSQGAAAHSSKWR